MIARTGVANTTRSACRTPAAKSPVTASAKREADPTRLRIRIHNGDMQRKTGDCRTLGQSQSQPERTANQTQSDNTNPLNIHIPEL
jgi:hypothetical protein